jgi:hypothetical protein
MHKSRLEQAGVDASVVRPNESLRGSGGVHAVWGINRRFGLLGSFAMSYGESLDGRSRNGWYTDIRASLSGTPVLKSGS